MLIAEHRSRTINTVLETKKMPITKANSKEINSNCVLCCLPRELAERSLAGYNVCRECIIRVTFRYDNFGAERSICFFGVSLVL